MSMMTRLVVCSLLAVLLASVWADEPGPTHHRHDLADIAATPGDRLDASLGTLHRPVSTHSKLAQAYFDQGLKLVSAFNHDVVAAPSHGNFATVMKTRLNKTSAKARTCLMIYLVN